MLLAEEMRGQGQGGGLLEWAMRVKQWWGLGVWGGMCSPGGSAGRAGGAAHLDDSQADGTPARGGGEGSVTTAVEVAKRTHTD